jgi:hypothetical protein
MARGTAASRTMRQCGVRRQEREGRRDREECNAGRVWPGGIHIARERELDLARAARVEQQPTWTRLVERAGERVADCRAKPTSASRT